jgi:hypothetical protein
MSEAGSMPQSIWLRAVALNCSMAGDLALLSGQA